MKVELLIFIIQIFVILSCHCKVVNPVKDTDKNKIFKVFHNLAIFWVKGNKFSFGLFPNILCWVYM